MGSFAHSSSARHLDSSRCQRNTHRFRMAPSDFNGKFKLAKDEKFDEYLTKVGVNLVKRKMALSMTPTVEVTIDGDSITMKNSLGADVKFTVGQKFEQES